MRKINVKSIRAKIHTFWQAFFQNKHSLISACTAGGVGGQFQADLMNPVSLRLKKNGDRHNCQTPMNTIRFYHAAIPQTHRCFSRLDDCEDNSLASKTALLRSLRLASPLTTPFYLPIINRCPQNPEKRTVQVEEISPKDRPAPETMGLGSHQRLPFLDVGRSLGTAHRMAPAALTTALRWRE